MHINDVRRVAKQMNINTLGMNKIEMIRSVQRAENTFECFATERLAHCNEHACLWREDCISANQEA